VIILQVKVSRVLANKAERDAPVSRYSHRPFSLPVEFQRVQVHAGNIQLLNRGCLFDQVKYPANARPVLGVDPTGVILLEEPFYALVSEIPNHRSSVIRLNTLCNRIDYITKPSRRLPVQRNHARAGPELVQVVRPLLHHLASLGQVLGEVVRRRYLVALAMRQLPLDHRMGQAEFM